MTQRLTSHRSPQRLGREAAATAASYRAFAGEDGRGTGCVRDSIVCPPMSLADAAYLLFDIDRRHAPGFRTFPDDWHDLTDADLYRLGMGRSIRDPSNAAGRPTLASGASLRRIGQVGADRPARLYSNRSSSVHLKAIHGLAEHGGSRAPTSMQSDTVFHELHAVRRSRMRADTTRISHSASSASAVIVRPPPWKASNADESAFVNHVRASGSGCHATRPMALRSAGDPVPCLHVRPVRLP